jgi:hypothetical protein
MRNDDYRACADSGAKKLLMADQGKLNRELTPPRTVASTRSVFRSLSSGLVSAPADQPNDLRSLCAFVRCSTEAVGSFGP